MVDLLIVEEAVEAAKEAVNVVEEDTATIVADHLVVSAAAATEEEEEVMIVVDRVEVIPMIAGVAEVEAEAISRRMDLRPGRVVVAGAILTLEVVRMVVGTPTVVIRQESMNVVSMVT